jgi:Bacterial extracellular solute-binding protein
VTPNPEFERIARQIEASLKKAGSEALATTVYKTKVADGGTVLTQIHHRQTPLFLMQGRAQAGVTWQSEAAFQEQAGNPITHVDIPSAQNTRAVANDYAYNKFAPGPFGDPGIDGSGRVGDPAPACLCRRSSGEIASPHGRRRTPFSARLGRAVTD